MAISTCFLEKTTCIQQVLNLIPESLYAFRESFFWFDMYNKLVRLTGYNVCLLSEDH